MKSFIPLILLIAGTIATALVAKAPDEMVKGKRRLGIMATIGATLSLMFFTAATGKSVEDTVGCMLFAFTEQCKQEAAETLIKKSTPLEPMVLPDTVRPRPGEKRQSVEELKRIQAENCRKAETPEPPRSPVRDINGVFPGMPLEDALEKMRCLYPGEEIRTEGEYLRFGDGKTAKIATAVVRYGGTTAEGERVRTGVFEITYDDLGGAREVLTVSHAFSYGDNELRVGDGMIEAIKAKYGAESTFQGRYVFSPEGKLQRELPEVQLSSLGGLSPEEGRKLKERREWGQALRNCGKLADVADPQTKKTCGAVITYRMRSNGVDVEITDMGVAARLLPLNAQLIERSAPAMKAVF